MRYFESRSIVVALVVLAAIIFGWTRSYKSAQANDGAGTNRIQIQEKVDPLTNERLLFTETIRTAATFSESATLRISCEGNIVAAELYLPMWVRAEAGFSAPNDTIARRTVRWSFDRRPPETEIWEERYGRDGSILRTTNSGHFVNDLFAGQSVVVEFSTPKGKQAASFSVENLRELKADSRWVRHCRGGVESKN